jgi:excreted virulence factor EspC (type VII ESX diderm)
MPEGGGYGVTAGELRTHAGKVDGHAQQMGQAVDAANQAMPDGAYGIICQFLPPVINETEQAAHEALTASKQALEETATGLRDTADNYERQDETGTSRFRGIEGQPR